MTGVYFWLRISSRSKEGRACLIDHRQWHLWYDIDENKKSDVKELAKNMGSVNFTTSNAYFEGVSLRP